MTDAGLHAGFGMVCITPPLGTRMMGYAGREQGCTAVHDDLFARMIALDDGAEPVLLAALDLCFLDGETAVRLKNAVSTLTGVPGERILLNCSHTHAGPVVARRWSRDEDMTYVDALVDLVAGAGEQALADRQPATLAVGSAPLDIGCNRRERAADGRVVLGINTDGPTLHEVTVWQLARGESADIVLFSAPFHGVTLGGGNLEISAEWMGLAVTELEARLEAAHVAFLQGCCGNQNVYRDEDSFEQVGRHAQRAAMAVLEALREARPIAGVPLRCVSRDVPVPRIEGEPMPVPVRGLRLGEAALVALGGEPFVEYAYVARALSAACSTMVLGYTDHCTGYLAVAETYDEGGYEAGANVWFDSRVPWTKEVEPILENAIEDVIGELGVAEPDFV